MSPTVSQKTAVKVVLGTMSFGDPGSEGARVDSVKDVETALDSLLKHGHCEVDAARIYSRGTSETILGKGLRKIIVESLKALNTDKLDIWYLHAPDRAIPEFLTR
ncbi:hypothetical protein B0H14DRAFT_3427876 [Mycena olivaceomarginata]|nr:hypothetical protein B0H14DRAFT_3427876 [Mycena olivaceomarginata]